MGHTYKPTDITRSFVQDHRERIEYLLGVEFPWLGTYLREKFFCSDINLIDVIATVRIARISLELMMHDPVEEPDDDFINDSYSSHVRFFDDEGVFIRF